MIGSRVENFSKSLRSGIATHKLAHGKVLRQLHQYSLDFNWLVLQCHTDRKTHTHPFLPYSVLFSLLAGK